jgi:hypothetical protein
LYGLESLGFEKDELRYEGGDLDDDKPEMLRKFIASDFDADRHIYDLSCVDTID